MTALPRTSRPVRHRFLPALIAAALGVVGLLPVSSAQALTPSTSFSFGRATDQVLVGDWDGDGKDTVMLRRGSTFYYRNTLTSGTVRTFTFGKASDKVLVGDWDGNGKDTIALRRGATYYYRNTLASGTASTFNFGRASDTAVAGDWNGDNRDTIALKRGATYYYRNTLTSGTARTFSFGRVTDKPVVGDWDGNTKDTIALRRGATYYYRNTLASGATSTVSFGRTTDAVSSGDWNGDRRDTLYAHRGTTHIASRAALGARAKDVWFRLGQCESGGVATTNTGNGFYGLYQFTLSTWRAMGGSGYPNHATTKEQTFRAQRLKAATGWSSWPGCAAKLGLS